jgi:hypothetical protein
LDPEELKRLLVYQADQHLNGSLIIQELEFSGFKSVKAKGVEFHRFGSLMAKLREVEVELSFWGLLQSRMSFSKVGLTGLEFFLNKRGQEWNTKQLFRKPEKNYEDEGFSNLPVVGKDPIENLFIDELQIWDSSINIDQAPNLKLTLTGTLSYPELRISQLKLDSGNSRLVASLDYQLNESQGNLKIIRSNLSIQEVSPFWPSAHGASGNIQIQGMLQWNKERFVPELRWISQDLKIQGDLLETHWSKMEGQWSETGLYFMSPVSTPRGDAWLSFLLNTPVKDILLGERLKGRVVLKEIQVFDWVQAVKITTDFSFSDKVIDFQRILVSNQGRDLVEAQGRYSFNSDKLSFALQGNVPDLSQHFPWSKGEITLEGKGTWTRFDGLEFSLENHSRNLSLLDRSSPDLRMEIQGGWQDGHLNLPLFRVQTSSGGSLLFQGLFDFTRNRTDLAQGHFRINGLELNPFLPRGWPKQNPSLTLTECKGRIQGPEISFKKLHGKLGKGKFSYEGNLFPFAGLANLFHGKLMLSHIPLEWIHPLIPSTLVADGEWHSEGPYQIELNTKQKTKLKISGLLDPGKLSSMDQINILGTVDLKDLTASLSSDLGNFDGILRVGVSQVDEGRIRGGIYSSKLGIPLPRPYPKLYPKNLELEFNIHKDPFLMRLKKFSGEIFSGRFIARGVSELEGRFLNQGNLELSDLNLNQILPFLEPSLSGRLTAALGGNLSFLSILSPVSGNIPLILDGSLSLHQPVFHAPASVQALIQSVKSSVVRGYFKGLSKYLLAKSASKTMDFEFHSNPEIIFNLSHGALQFPQISFIDKLNRFQVVSTSPIELSLAPTPARLTVLKGDLEIDMENIFLRSEFPYLKEDFKSNLQTKVKLEGSLSHPILKPQWKQMHRKIVRDLLQVSDLKKIQISKTAELENLKGNLLGDRERETAKARGREYLLQMLSPRGQSRVRGLMGRMTSSSTPLALEETHTKAAEVATIEHQLQAAREKLESMLGDEF